MVVALFGLHVIFSVRGEYVEVDAEDDSPYIFFPESSFDCIRGTGEALHIGGHVVGVRPERSVDDRRINGALCLGCPDVDEVRRAFTAKTRPHLVTAGAIGLYKEAEQDVYQNEESKRTCDDGSLVIFAPGILQGLRSLSVAEILCAFRVLYTFRSLHT